MSACKALNLYDELGPFFFFFFFGSNNNNSGGRKQTKTESDSKQIIDKHEKENWNLFLIYFFV